MSTGQVLVTGGSGFVAGHIIMQLLAEGHHVRATIRELSRADAARDVLAHAGLEHPENLEFVAADLLSDDGWAEAMSGVTTVFHVASPVQPGAVANEDELIVPAREGTLRVLRAADEAGVERVVLTSAFHAVGWGHPHDDHVFTEEDWTDIDGPGVDAYGKSKTLAERAAWDFVESGDRSFTLTTMLPVAVMGPVLGSAVSGANHVVQNMLRGAIPAFPRLFFPIVDVRDVARAHVLAGFVPGAAGQRFLLSNGQPTAMADIGALIREHLGDAASKVTTQLLPDEVVHAGAADNPQLRAMEPDLGYARATSNEKARSVLGWQPRPASEAIIAAAESMTERGMVTG